MVRLEDGKIEVQCHACKWLITIKTIAELNQRSWNTDGLVTAEGQKKVLCKFCAERQKTANETAHNRLDKSKDLILDFAMNLIGSSGSFGGVISEDKTKFILPRYIFSACEDLGLRTAEALVTFLYVTPQVFANKIYWSVESTEAAYEELVLALEGHITQQFVDDVKEVAGKNDNTTSPAEFKRREQAELYKELSQGYSEIGGG